MEQTVVTIRDSAETDYTYTFNEVWEGAQSPAVEKALIQLSEEIHEGIVEPELPVNKLVVVDYPRGTALIILEVE